MITPIEEILGQITPAYAADDIDLLKGWALAIIDECAKNAEFTMETPTEIQYDNYTDDFGNPVYPVLMRSTIYNVEKQII